MLTHASSFRRREFLMTKSFLTRSLQTIVDSQKGMKLSRRLPFAASFSALKRLSSRSWRNFYSRKAFHFINKTKSFEVFFNLFSCKFMILIRRERTKFAFRFVNIRYVNGSIRYSLSHHSSFVDELILITNTQAHTQTHTPVLSVLWM